MDNLWVVAELFSELPCLSVGALVPWPDVVVKNRRRAELLTSAEHPGLNVRDDCRPPWPWRSLRA